MPPALMWAPAAMVAVDQNKENVRSFGVYTQDHEQLIVHLREYGITSVAMESTGSYGAKMLHPANALQCLARSWI